MTEPINMTPSGKKEEPPHVCNCLKWQRATALLCALLLLIVSGLVVARLQGKDETRPPMPRQARNSAEAELFRSLVPATPAEAMAMALAAERQGHSYLAVTIREVSGVFIATKDFRLAPGLTDEDSIVIGVPKGVKWLGGPRNNAVMVFANSFYQSHTSALWKLADGYVVYDPLCWPPSHFAQRSLAPKIPCNDSPLKPQAEWLAANKQHRLLTPAESDKNAPFVHKVDDPWPNDYPMFLSKGDVWLWPNKPAGRRPVMLLQEGHYILGGVLRDGIVMRHTTTSPRENWEMLVDPLYYNPASIRPGRPAEGFPRDLCDVYLGEEVKKVHLGMC